MDYSALKELIEECTTDRGSNNEDHVSIRGPEFDNIIIVSKAQALKESIKREIQKLNQQERIFFEGAFFQWIKLNKGYGPFIEDLGAVGKYLGFWDISPEGDLQKVRL